MYFPKPKSGMSLPGPIKETMVDCHPDASVPNMSWIGSNEHGLIMGRKVAPESSIWKTVKHDDTDT